MSRRSEFDIYMVLTKTNDARPPLLDGSINKSFTLSQALLKRRHLSITHHSGPTESVSSISYKRTTHHRAFP